QETARPISVLDAAARKALVAEKGGLLIARRARDGDAPAGEFRLTQELARRFDLRQQRRRDAEVAKNFIVPRERVNIEEHGPRGVRNVGRMHAAVREPPQEPGVNRAAGQLAALSASANAGQILEQPGALGAREIGVGDQAGFFAESAVEALAPDAIAHFGGAATLPDDGVMD